MLNIRVSDIEACKAYCLANGITVVDEIESFEYGKFLHILDPDQNKIELWEPNDSVYETMVGDKKNKLK
jgi:predicted enzyme related to lactoylglutathione lyase